VEEKRNFTKLKRGEWERFGVLKEEEEK